MARHETDREDLLREATALVERAELKLPRWNDPVVIGFRREGSASVYIGAEPAYHFNSAGELRRAYAGGLLYKAERGCLVALRRQHEAEIVALVRHELSADEQDAFLAAARERLESLAANLRSGEFQCTGEISLQPGFISRFADWLANVTASPLKVAATPHAR